MLHRATAPRGFYSSWRAGQVERQVLQLLAAASQRLAAQQSPYRVFPLQRPAFQWAAAQEDPAALR